MEKVKRDSTLWRILTCVSSSTFRTFFFTLFCENQIFYQSNIALNTFLNFLKNIPKESASTSMKRVSIKWKFWKFCVERSVTKAISTNGNDPQMETLRLPKQYPSRYLNLRGYAAVPHLIFWSISGVWMTSQTDVRLSTLAWLFPNIKGRSHFRTASWFDFVKIESRS